MVAPYAMIVFSPFFVHTVLLNNKVKYSFCPMNNRHLYMDVQMAWNERFPQSQFQKMKSTLSYVTVTTPSILTINFYH
jgi:hypothetical protein